MPGNSTSNRTTPECALESPCPATAPYQCTAGKAVNGCRPTTWVGVIDCAASCRLRSAEKPPGRAPRQVIVAAFGRGGSAVFCGTLAALGKSDVGAMQEELFGQDPQAVLGQSDPAQLMSAWFAHQSERQPDAHFIGFKWKQFLDNGTALWAPLPQYDAALTWAASHGVVVLHMRRNELDDLISAAKHQQDAALAAHCFAGDAACVAEHTRRPVAMDASRLGAQLSQMAAGHEALRSLLEAKGVNFTTHSFEDLFAGEETTRHRHGHADVDETLALRAWSRVLELLGVPPPAEYATVARAIEATALVDTSVQTQCDELENADEVRAALRGTKYAALMRC